jgi:hypothetical protein
MATSSSSGALRYPIPSGRPDWDARVAAAATASDLAAGLIQDATATANEVAEQARRAACAGELASTQPDPSG